MGGQVQAYFATVPGTIEHIRAGTGALAGDQPATRLGCASRCAADWRFVPGYETSNWYGLGAPTDTPAEIIERLNKEVNAGLADPK